MITIQIAGAVVRAERGVEPVDFRKGADGLVALVREALGTRPVRAALRR